MAESWKWRRLIDGMAQEGKKMPRKEGMRKEIAEESFKQCTLHSCHNNPPGRKAGRKKKRKKKKKRNGKGKKEGKRMDGKKFMDR